MTKKMQILALSILFFFLQFISEASAISDSGLKSTISNYDVKVRINTDGSLDITENVKFTSFGDYNNTMLLIDRRDNEEVEIKNVYMLQKNGYIECERLSAGQWDANVFSGTYSVIQETDCIRIKVYGTFSKRNGSIVVQYRVKNGIRRYRDIAVYERSHVFRNWEGRIANINISVSLPLNTEIDSIHAFLHGVLVGKKKVESGSEISFNIPDTVPGEYAEARILFPQKLVFKAPYTDLDNHLSSFLQEEDEYAQSDKEELLRARENAAKEAGRRAWAERMTRRAKLISAVFSVLASLAGLFTLWRISKKLHQLKKTPIPHDLRNIERLSPAEVRLLLSNGKTGARGVLGALLSLVSSGYLEPGIGMDDQGRPVFKFSPSGKIKDGLLPVSDEYLLNIALKYSDETEGFNPGYIMKQSRTNDGARTIKSVYRDWEQLVLRDYADKNVLGSGISLYRNIGLLFGAVLFFLGCIIPVSLSIWSGYTMLIVGLLLFLYSLRIRKHTDYGISQYRVWVELKKRMMRRTIALDGLPVWMTGPYDLLGYVIALGTEKELTMVEVDVEKNGIDLFKNTDSKEGNTLANLVKQTVAVLDKALSSVQDAS